MELPEQLYTVSELTAEIKTLLQEHFPVVWVTGEISNLRDSHGHRYFTLKDASASIPCAMWKSYAGRLRFDVQDGQQVVVSGRIDLYEPYGRYQLIVQQIIPKGLGELQLAFIQLREKLAAEGLFDPAHKRPLPYLPSHIGIVTSPTGAAVRDIIDRILKRFPRARVTVCPVRCQGEGAAQDIAAGIELMGKYGVDVLVVGRGGGSVEDLWAFNEEVVARAIYASPVPVISAVGHERDVTISDLVADCRANTPTHAGELVVPELADIEDRLADARGRLRRALVNRLRRAQDQVDALAKSYGFRATPDRVYQCSQRLDEIETRLRSSAGHRMTAARDRTLSLAGRLEALGPLRVLERGYSITLLHPDGKALKDASVADVGKTILTLLSKGRILSRITEVHREARK